jgi:hypothetical protein
MKPYQFDLNTPSMSFTYTRTREGPNYFVSHYKGITKGHNDPKDCWRTLGSAKFTDTGKALKEWCLSMHDQYGDDEASEASGRKDTSFASEAMEEQSPTDNTRMVM